MSLWQQTSWQLKRGWWDEEAHTAGRAVRVDEEQTVRHKENEFAIYNSEEIDVAIVHARQDIASIASLLSAANLQLKWIRWLLAAIAILLLVLVCLGLEGSRTAADLINRTFAR